MNDKEKRMQDEWYPIYLKFLSVMAMAYSCSIVPCSVLYTGWALYILLTSYLIKVSFQFFELFKPFGHVLTNSS